jgi:hypothetical protein
MAYLLGRNHPIKVPGKVAATRLAAPEPRIDGAGPDGRPAGLRGTGRTVVRPRPDGSWRIAAGAWRPEGL